MKTLTFIFSGLLLVFFISCSLNTAKPGKSKITDMQLVMIHQLIERTHTDTVKKYLNDYITRYNVPVSAKGLPDGNYAGESPYDDYGYKHIISIVIKDGLIDSVFYDEVYKDGHSKTADTAYCRRMNENVSGSAPAITYPVYATELTKKQNIQQVDAISGATYSLYRMQYAAILAFLKAGK
jgi:major membrane immunogen (membrane-anchored lipoprotein)